MEGRQTFGALMLFGHGSVRDSYGWLAFFPRRKLAFNKYLCPSETQVPALLSRREGRSCAAHQRHRALPGSLRHDIYLPNSRAGRRELSDFQNEALMKRYSAEDMLVCHDLWYWGFFTQIPNNKTRERGWNSEKFWCQPAAPSAQGADLQRMGEEFILICQGQ